jgi:lipid-binding SYLF domain-containing protein
MGMSRYSRSIAAAGVVRILVTLGCVVLAAPAAYAASAAELNRDSASALKGLVAANPKADAIAKEARAILVFPRIYKAGFLFGGQFGDGALREGDKVIGYYRSVAASYGLQAGVQAFGYALFFMNDNALAYLKKSEGFELGVGPSIVVLDKGMAGSLSTTTGRSDIYAVFFDQKGLMAGLGIQGTKITRIHPK